MGLITSSAYIDFLCHRKNYVSSFTAQSYVCRVGVWKATWTTCFINSCLPSKPVLSAAMWSSCSIRWNPKCFYLFCLHVVIELSCRQHNIQFSCHYLVAPLKVMTGVEINTHRSRCILKKHLLRVWDRVKIYSLNFVIVDSAYIFMTFFQPVRLFFTILLFCGCEIGTHTEYFFFFFCKYISLPKMV